MDINWAFPGEQRTPSGQYILALDGHDWQIQLPVIGQNILAFLHVLEPVAEHFNNREVESIAIILASLN
jgi:hypothetical protein